MSVFTNVLGLLKLGTGAARIGRGESTVADDLAAAEQAITDEATARSTADGTLQDNITAEAEARSVAISAIPAPGLVPIGAAFSVTAATPVVDIEGNFTSDYEEYLIVGNGLKCDTDSVYLRAQLKIDGAYQTDNYVFYVINGNSASTGVSAAVSGSGSVAPSIMLSGFILGNQSEAKGNVRVGVFTPTDTTSEKMVDIEFTGFARADNNANQFKAVGSGRHKTSTAALTGVRIFFTEGNVIAGSFQLYGRKKL